MEEVGLNKKDRLYISDTPVVLDASSILPSSVQDAECNISWLTKLLVQSDIPILEKLKRDSA